jgi:transposase-like protein
VLTRIAKQLGIGPEAVRQWVNQAEIDAGQRAGSSSAGTSNIDTDEGPNFLGSVEAVGVRDAITEPGCASPLATESFERANEWRGCWVQP